MYTWVVGGNSGIGKATSEYLLEHRKEVMITDAVSTNVRHVDDIIDFYADHVGKIEAVVFSAGINVLDWYDEMSYSQLADAERIIDVNLMGFIRLMSVLSSKPLNTTHPLKVVAVSSDAATRPMRTSAAYCASKAGLNMAVKVAARELGPHGWRINAVSPGMTAPTGMSKYIDRRVPRVRNWSSQQTLEYEKSQEVVPGRIAPIEVAEVIYSTLCGPAHLNGSIIEINGGR